MLQLRNISKSYNGRVILQDINLSINEGEIFGVVGRSGAGKSTLLKIINLLEHPDSGDVVLGITNLTKLSKSELLTYRRNIGMIFQHFNLIENKTVYSNVAFPLIISGKFTNIEINDKVIKMLDLVGLSEYSLSYPSNLSGGQKQRVGIARALITNPSLLLCDEATSALDPETTANVLQLLLEINQSIGISIVLITHEIDVVRKICDRVAVIDAGAIVEIGETPNMVLNPIHPVARKVFVEEDVFAYVKNISPSYKFNQNGHHLVLLNFIGDVTYLPILHTIGQIEGVNYSILRGNIGKIKDKAFGQLLVDFKYSINSDAIFDILNKNNVSYQLMEL